MCTQNIITVITGLCTQNIITVITGLCTQNRITVITGQCTQNRITVITGQCTQNRITVITGLCTQNRITVITGQCKNKTRRRHSVFAGRTNSLNGKLYYEDGLGETIFILILFLCRMRRPGSKNRLEKFKD